VSEEERRKSFFPFLSSPLQRFPPTQRKEGGEKKSVASKSIPSMPVLFHFSFSSSFLSSYKRKKGKKRREKRENVHWLEEGISFVS